MADLQALVTQILAVDEEHAALALHAAVAVVVAVDRGVVLVVRADGGEREDAHIAPRGLGLAVRGLGRQRAAAELGQPLSVTQTRSLAVLRNRKPPGACRSLKPAKSGSTAAMRSRIRR